MTTARMLTGAFILLGGLCAGCQQKSTALNHVTGKVMYKGTALTGGLIVFTPDASRGESGKIAHGAIQHDGSYTLRTGDADGVTAGWYRVTVASVSGSTPSLNAPPAFLVPDHYCDPQRSLLQCEVKGNRDNHLDFNLD